MNFVCASQKSIYQSTFLLGKSFSLGDKSSFALPEATTEVHPCHFPFCEAYKDISSCTCIDVFQCGCGSRANRCVPASTTAFSVISDGCVEAVWQDFLLMEGLHTHWHDADCWQTHQWCHVTTRWDGNNDVAYWQRSLAKKYTFPLGIFYTQYYWMTEFMFYRSDLLLLTIREIKPIVLSSSFHCWHMKSHLTNIWLPGLTAGDSNIRYDHIHGQTFHIQTPTR